MKSILLWLVFSTLAFSSCETSLSTFTAENVTVDSTVTTHPTDSLIVPYRKKMGDQMNQVLGTSDSTLTGFAPESPLGNLVADAVYQKGLEALEAEVKLNDFDLIFSILNFGGIRRSLNAGTITLGNIYELMPFDNTLVVVKLSPSKLNEIATYLKSVKGQPISNAYFDLRADAATFYNDVFNESNVVNWSQDFYVITSDYLAGGGDRMDFFKDPLQTWQTGILIRDILVEYIRDYQRIRYTPIEGRIKL